MYWPISRPLDYLDHAGRLTPIVASSWYQPRPESVRCLLSASDKQKSAIRNDISTVALDQKRLTQSFYIAASQALLRYGTKAPILAWLNAPFLERSILASRVPVTCFQGETLRCYLKLDDAFSRPLGRSRWRSVIPASCALPPIFRLPMRIPILVCSLRNFRAAPLRRRWRHLGSCCFLGISSAMVDGSRVDITA